MTETLQYYIIVYMNCVKHQENRL